MTMTRGANGILTRTLTCVNDVDLGATWSSYKGSMVHREAQNMAMPRLPVFEIRGQVWPTSLGLAGH